MSIIFFLKLFILCKRHICNMKPYINSSSVLSNKYSESLQYFSSPYLRSYTQNLDLALFNVSSHRLHMKWYIKLCFAFTAASGVQARFVNRLKILFPQILFLVFIINLQIGLMFLVEFLQFSETIKTLCF